MIVEALLGIAVMIAIAYIVVFSLKPKTEYDGESAVYELQQKNPVTVLPSNFAPWDVRPCALRFGIFLQHAPRTLAKVDCIIPSTTPITEFKPSCENYEYKTCKCNDTSCNNCAVPNDTYLSKLLAIDNKLELWASGYTNQNDKPYVPALLKVYTEKDETNKTMESIPLPTIPLQRWTIITIVKQGRRFDVYYGQELVASKITEFVPRVPEANRNWVAGHPLWKGQIGFFKGWNQPWTKYDVQKDVTSLVNTRGIPFYIDRGTFELTNPFSVECPFGNCNPMPTVKLSNPFEVYNTRVN